MVSYNEHDLRGAVYIMPLPEYVRRYISGGNGCFTLVFDTFSGIFSINSFFSLIFSSDDFPFANTYL